MSFLRILVLRPAFIDIFSNQTIHKLILLANFNMSGFHFIHGTSIAKAEVTCALRPIDKHVPLCVFVVTFFDKMTIHDMQKIYLCISNILINLSIQENKPRDI